MINKLPERSTSIFLPTKKFYFGYRFKFADIVFLWVSNIFNLLIIINFFLKNVWGRARPGDILQLGGKENFTAWYQISDSCSSNCSFVSGDASVGFSIIALYFLTKKEVFFWLSLFLGCSLGLIRIMEGGHFLSDIVMSAVILYLSFQTTPGFHEGWLTILVLSLSGSICWPGIKVKPVWLGLIMVIVFDNILEQLFALSVKG